MPRLSEKSIEYDGSEDITLPPSASELEELAAQSTQQEPTIVVPAREQREPAANNLGTAFGVVCAIGLTAALGWQLYQNSTQQRLGVSASGATAEQTQLFPEFVPAEERSLAVVNDVAAPAEDVSVESPAYPGEGVAPSIEAPGEQWVFANAESSDSLPDASAESAVLAATSEFTAEPIYTNRAEVGADLQEQLAAEPQSRVRYADAGALSNFNGVTPEQRAAIDRACWEARSTSPELGEQCWISEFGRLTSPQQ